MPKAAGPMPDPAGNLPRILITMGNPDGVGPEVAAGAWPDPRLLACCRPAVAGDPEVFQKAVSLRKTGGKVVRFDQVGDVMFDASSPQVMPCLAAGAGGASTGEAAYAAIRLAADLTLAGEVDAMVTGPISKASLQAAGHNFPGHTELLADLCGVDDFAMMLYLPQPVVPRSTHGLAVVHVTLHTSLRSVFDQLSTSKILAKCHLADQAMRRFGCQSPRIGVAALNPHAGEQGIFGDEEQTIIEPAVHAAQQQGIQASGPHPVDTLMVRAREGEFDAVVAMYHDQGHIALKLLGMHQAVNVTLGLPIIRTSVAHGTAPDIAWRGIAETSGLLAAAETAAMLAARQNPIA